MTEQAQSKPRLVIEFAGPGQADMNVKAEGVSPAQLYAAAWYLDAMARGQYADGRIAAAVEAQQIAALAAGIKNGGRA